MIKKLRYKFVIMSMSAITLVLIILVGVTNVANYISVDETTDELIELLEYNKGSFYKDNMIHKPNKPSDIEISPELPFQTRYFTVLFNKKGDVLQVDTGRIAATSTKMAIKYAETLMEQGKTSGRIDQYKYKAVDAEKGTMYIFVDVEKEMTSFWDFLGASIAVSIATWIVLGILMIIVSKWAVKSIALSYEKQKRFITNASHELKTPITVIDANLEVIEISSGENEWTSSIRNQINKLTSLTEKLVYLSRMDEDNTKMVMTDFSLSDAIEESTKPYITVAESLGKNIALEVDENISLYGEEMSIRQLITILLDNAMKYTDDKGDIKISLKENGKYKELIVSNSVDKIEKGNLDIIFERFYRLDDSRNSMTGGTGIGLSIAKSIVLAHKGKISARSADSKSLTIKILFV